MPATTVAEIPAKFPALFPGYHTSLSSNPNIAAAANCTESVSANVHGYCSDIAADKETDCTNTASSGYCPSSYKTPIVAHATKSQCETSSAGTTERRSSMSPPKLMSFWEEIDAIFDGPTDERPDLFPVNVDDDPPFMGFDPVLDHLDDLDDVESRHGEFQNSAWFRSKFCGILDKENELHLISPGKSYSVCNLQRRQLRDTADKEMPLIEASHQCIIDEDIMFNYDSPQKQPGVIVSSDAGKSAAEDCGYVSHRCVVDDDIMFNYASPQKERGIVFSSDTKKSTTKDRRVPARTSSPKHSIRRRKRLFDCENGKVPSATSGRSVSQSSLQCSTRQRRCSRRKKSSSKTSVRGVDRE